MFDPEITNTAGLDLSIVNGILDRLPTLQSLCLAPIWAVQEEQVYITQPALLDRLFDRLARRFVRGVRCELGREVDILALQRPGILLTGNKSEDCFAHFVLVMIHLCRVDAGVLPV